MSRRRCVTPGRLTLTGRAWSGYGPVERVEVSTDGGLGFAAAALGERVGTHAWSGRRFEWNATDGEHVISSRAVDAAGNTRP